MSPNKQAQNRCWKILQPSSVSLWFTVGPCTWNWGQKAAEEVGGGVAAGLSLPGWSSPVSRVTFCFSCSRRERRVGARCRHRRALDRCSSLRQDLTSEGLAQLTLPVWGPLAFLGSWCYSFSFLFLMQKRRKHLPIMWGNPAAASLGAFPSLAFISVQVY